MLSEHSRLSGMLLVTVKMGECNDEQADHERFKPSMTRLDKLFWRCMAAVAGQTWILDR